ncbi:MAG: hypothetical protein ACUVX8_10855 [Candidatus Zipacnadales bacterium]
MNLRHFAIAVGIGAAFIAVVAIYVLAQPAAPQAPNMPGGDFANMMMAGWPPAPMPVVVVADDAIYVACDGVLKAYEPKTLKPLGETIYWQRPELM